jgi:hypothetical protein
MVWYRIRINPLISMLLEFWFLSLRLNLGMMTLTDMAQGFKETAKVFEFCPIVTCFM